MSTRPYACLFLVTLLTGCNLILPSIPEDGTQGFDTLGDGSWAPDTVIPKETYTWPDRITRPDTPQMDSMQTGDESSDVPVIDGGGDLFSPPIWNCGTPMELLSPTVETTSFTRFAQQAENNFVYIWYSQCGSDEPISGPELGWFLQVDQIATISVQVSCVGPCWAYLMKDGCSPQNTETCWNPQETPTLTWDVLPGTWFVAVEQMEEVGVPAAPGWIGPPFDIHTALNRTHSYPGCFPDGSLPLSEVLAEGSCETIDGTTWRVWTRTGTLPSPGAGPDRAWLPCTAGAAPIDPVGGTPEYILRLDADLPGDGRRVDAIATLDPAAQGGLPTWAGVLGLAGPPCGETATLVDCDGGLKKELHVQDVTLLPGQEAFLYLDGVGSEALGGPIERPYRLDIRVEADCDPSLL